MRIGSEIIFRRSTGHSYGLKNLKNIITACQLCQIVNRRRPCLINLPAAAGYPARPASGRTFDLTTIQHELPHPPNCCSSSCSTRYHGNTMATLLLGWWPSRMAAKSSRSCKSMPFMRLPPGTLTPGLQLWRGGPQTALQLHQRLLKDTDEV